MYGAIFGDLAGSIYEYDQSKRIACIQPKQLITEDSFYSDDTILTIAILDAILDNQDYNYYLRKYIKETLDSNYSPKFETHFRYPFSRGLREWAKQEEMGSSTGNGALMRISPVGFMFDDAEEVFDNAIKATEPSHNSSEALHCATILALMIYYLRNGYSKDEVYQRLKLPVSYQPFQKFNFTCYETFGNCLYAFYQSNGFEDAIFKTLYMGGDTDTNAAIVGSMAEAYYGIEDSIIDTIYQKIPDDYIKVLEKAKKCTKK